MNSSTYQLADNVLFQKVVDETVILEPETGEYFTLDSVGTFMIEQLQSGATFGETLDKVRASYDTNGADIEHDLSKLLSEMKLKGLMIER
jgi:hypothetical protein